ncbi:MAG: hypothetical protein QG657_55 [Acidobacteriota bacterium]|nr:hypothetical protein [Acidobacteriota bacterium]
MSHMYKPGYEKIQEHIKTLEKQNWLTPVQKIWPRYLFHFTELSNVINILTGGALLSRELLKEKKISSIDIASPHIIEHTPQEWKNYVRLYFRPKTPTQYRNEGIRSKNEMTLDAHCPIPVMLVFDAFKVLVLESTYISNGNLCAQGVEVDNSVDFYLKLPFEFIYHDKGFSRLNEAEQNKIKFHRHAEVLIRDSLGLSFLEFICCRSNAEYQTLIHRLPENVQGKWSGKIRIDQKAFLFFCEWVYIKEVKLSSERIIFEFNQRPSASFSARLEIEECQTNKQYLWEEKNFCPPGIKEFDLSTMKHPECYKVSFFLDEHLAFQAVHREESGIF